MIAFGGVCQYTLLIVFTSKFMEFSPYFSIWVFLTHLATLHGGQCLPLHTHTCIGGFLLCHVQYWTLHDNMCACGPHLCCFPNYSTSSSFFLSMLDFSFTISHNHYSIVPQYWEKLCMMSSILQ